jgi:hypothetical protein
MTTVTRFKDDGTINNRTFLTGPDQVLTSPAVNSDE